MSSPALTLRVDGVEVQAQPGQTLLQACDAAGVYIPRLCYHPDLPPGGNCRICTCKVNGKYMAACHTPAVHGMVVENDTPELTADRRTLVEMLFIEGNHWCPGCEKSGACELQATGYRLGMAGPGLPYLWPQREIDATHPDVYVDRNRCILCGLCIRASTTVDGKTVFGFENRGLAMRLAVDGDAGAGATSLAATDRAVQVCPVACLVPKRTGFEVPPGARRYDQEPIGADIEARNPKSETRNPKQTQNPNAE
jgi:[NiFe] hydrogenase diaphorase moiety small subunit